MPDNKDPLNTPSTIPFNNGAFNPYAVSPQQATASNVIASPSISAGGASFDTGGAAQGNVDYQGQYQLYLNSIKQNPNFGVANYQTNLPQATFTAQQVNMPQADFGNNAQFNSTQHLLNDNLNSNISGLNDTYNSANAMLDGQLGQLNTTRGNNLTDIAHTKADSLGNTDRTYNQALGFNNRLFQDQGLQLNNGLRAGGALDSSANDANYSGSARNKLLGEFGQRQSDANYNHDQTLNNIDTSYNKAFNDINTQYSTAAQNIANQKELNIREKAQKQNDLRLQTSQQLLDLKGKYDDYQNQAKVAAAKAAAAKTTSGGINSGANPLDFGRTGTDTTGTTGTNGAVLGASSIANLLPAGGLNSMPTSQWTLPKIDSGYQYQNPKPLSGEDFSNFGKNNSPFGI
jgi:hypothetical protein